jgi:hypothetical protein
VAAFACFTVYSVTLRAGKKCAPADDRPGSVPKIRANGYEAGAPARVSVLLDLGRRALGRVADVRDAGAVTFETGVRINQVGGSSATI